MDILGRYDLDAIALCQVDKDALVLAHDVDALIGQQYLLIICRLNSKYFLPNIQKPTSPESFLKYSNSHQQHYKSYSQLKTPSQTPFLRSLTTYSLIINRCKKY